MGNAIPKYRLFIDNNNNKIIEYKNIFNKLKSLINSVEVFNVDNFINEFNSKKNIKPKNPKAKLKKINVSEKINIEQPLSLSETLQTTPIIKNSEIENSVIT